MNDHKHGHDCGCDHGHQEERLTDVVVNEGIRRLAGMKSAEARKAYRDARGYMPFDKRDPEYQAAARALFAADVVELRALAKSKIGFMGFTLADAIADRNREKIGTPVQILDMQADGADAFAVVTLPGDYAALGTIHQRDPSYGERAGEAAIIWELMRDGSDHRGWRSAYMATVWGRNHMARGTVLFPEDVA